MREANHVKRIRFAPAARQRSRSGLYDKCRVALNFVAFCSVTGVTNVQVTGEKQICSAPGQRLHRHACTSNHFAFMTTFGQIEGMMRNHDLHYLITEFTYLSMNRCLLCWGRQRQELLTELFSESAQGAVLGLQHLRLVLGKTARTGQRACAPERCWR